ncbi:lipid carrier--UDP-N-acetylgalactosaminyltransferase, partial [Methylophaga nitratireducenticrescens]
MIRLLDFTFALLGLVFGFPVLVLLYIIGLF